MVVYDLLLLDNNVYSKIAVIGNKDVYNYLNTKVDKEWVEIDFIEDFKDYTRNPRVYHRVINGLENVDYEKIYNSIHHQGWLVVLPEIYDYDLKQKLEDINFVAINETDKHITAKRMHGWGNK
jgi:uncharacterized protein YcgL (UPF0745 family)